MRRTTLSISVRKRRPKPGASTSYQSCAATSSARAASVKRTGTLRATLFEFCLKGFPSDALGAVVIERCEATLKLGLLGRCQSHLVVIQAVPKLRDQCKTFLRGQEGDFVMSELHWFRLAEPTASADSS